MLKRANTAELAKYIRSAHIHRYYLYYISTRMYLTRMSYIHTKFTLPYVSFWCEREKNNRTHDIIILYSR